MKLNVSVCLVDNVLLVFVLVLTCRLFVIFKVVKYFLKLFNFSWLTGAFKVSAFGFS